MGQSHRTLKVADRIKVVVANLLETKIKDPRLGFVTVTDARVTGDLQQASIFYTVLVISMSALQLRRLSRALRVQLDPHLAVNLVFASHRALNSLKMDYLRVQKLWILYLKKFMSRMLKLLHFARMRNMQGEKILTKLHVLLKINCDPNNLRARVFGCR